MENKQKRSRKLLVQIGLIVGILFVVVIAINITIIYRGTVDVYLNAKNENMAEKLKNAKLVYNSENIATVINYWEANPKVCSELLSDEETLMIENSDNYETFLNDKEFFTSDKYPESDRNLMARALYSAYVSYFNYEKDFYDYESVFCIDITDDNLGFVIFECSDRDNNKTLGDRYDIDLSDHPALEQLRDGEKEVVFEKTSDYPFKGKYYVGYSLVDLDGVHKLAMGISYNWSDFNSGMRVALRVMTVVCIIGILLSGAILLLFIYRKAIKPLEAVKHSVVEYMETKESGPVISRMSEIRIQNEIGVLAQEFAALALEIDQYTNENIRLAGERERVGAELDMAKSIQASQLPSKFPAFPDRTEFDLYASMTPAKEVGGDFYDFFLIDDDRLGLVIADVSGKGVPAALFMMISKLVIRHYAMEGLTPREVLSRTNETICENNTQEMFVTVWFGILEISTGKITASNAGHEYPIIGHSESGFELFKDKHGVPLGARSGMKFKEYELTLTEGDTLFLYTDGVPEATAANEEMFGLQRMTDTMNSVREAEPEELLRTIHGAVDAFVGSEPQFDDLTMLAVKYKKPQS
ncbi:MAG: PP2C family protein-serine/threonine phosphatase [Ruminococcus sp.]|nr:PP2C family protein-serine/threonine phosphatase [Ruminococcus sp.]